MSNVNNIQQHNYGRSTVVNVTYLHGFITNINSLPNNTFSKPVPVSLVKSSDIESFFTMLKHCKLTTSANINLLPLSAQMEEKFSLTDLPFTTASNSKRYKGLVPKPICYHHFTHMYKHWFDITKHFTIITFLTTS